MMNRYWNINRLSSNHCEPLFTIIIPLYSWICDPGNPKNHSYSPQKVFPEVSIGKTMSTISSFGVHVSLYIMYTYIYIHMYLYVSLWHDYLKKNGNESSLQHHSSTGIVNTNPAESNETPAGAYRKKCLSSAFKRPFGRLHYYIPSSKLA
jgi:hypothetical protein